MHLTFTVIRNENLNRPAQLTCTTIPYNSDYFFDSSVNKTRQKLEDMVYFVIDWFSLIDEI
jgi:hypothetical protein